MTRLLEPHRRPSRHAFSEAGEESISTGVCRANGGRAEREESRWYW